MFEHTSGFRVFFWISLVCLTAFLFFPLYWMLNSALKPASDIFELSFIPHRPTWDHFAEVFRDREIRRYFVNSLTLSIASCVFTTIISAYAGYSFSKYRYRGRMSFMLLFLLAKMFPYAVLLLSMYALMLKLQLLDNYLSLVLAYVTFTLPVGCWTLKTYFDGIPDELIESAKIDGAGNARILHRVILPLALPGLVSVAIYGFVWSWNDLLYSLTLVTSPEKRTLAPGLILSYLGEAQQDWGGMMAASIAVSLPVTLLFLLLQRYFIQGLVAGAVKG
ncbi:carbohydrate ABC transporter permease [Paenibacillus glycinis]|uniref:ABC transporter permease subunit n=1 Tax=Paenibacillus glycinis TaxID=2697035 RepID=A0ABW9XSS1_9BACL|nr:carbohydrate ABC transporter permease [Paenibacillus glycinis]NBD25712.1 ABC transporter permease subunit [Paenibacillus glycinis]